MTALEKYKLDRPNCECEIDIVQKCCPDFEVISLDTPDYCSGGADISDCESCWNREIPEESTHVCNCYDHEDKRCNGTRERDKCSCGGNESQCDFYPEKRGETEKKTIYAHMSPFDSVSDRGLVIGDEEVEHPDTDTPKILDSGNRREFETGAVRDIQEGKGRCDLMPLDVVAEYLTLNNHPNPVIWHIHLFQESGKWEYLFGAIDQFNEFHFKNDRTVLLEVSKHFEEGAKKYGENNWQKGIPTNCYIDSAVRHYLKFLRGDTDEPHDRAFVWNLLCCIWTCKHKPELNVYRKEN